jgi:predicted transcriptional regulator
MTNITFSVDDDLHKKMKEHPEIKWTEIFRQSIVNYLKKVEEIDVLSILEFKKRVDPEILKKIDELNEQDETMFYEKAKKLEEERLKQLQESERRVVQ